MKRLLVFLVLIAALSPAQSPLIPVTARSGSESGQAARSTGDFQPALGPQKSGSPVRQITSVILPGSRAYRVVDQPANNPGFVSSAEDTLTRFSLAQQYGSTGLLAHNNLAGASFLDLRQGDRIDLVVEEQGHDQSIASYWVFSIRKFQALSPNSPYSNFVDLATQAQFSASQLFLEIYDRDNLLILQTCLEKDGVDSWGRVFVMAYPVNAQFYKPWPQGNELAMLH